METNLVSSVRAAMVALLLSSAGLSTRAQSIAIASEPESFVQSSRHNQFIAAFEWSVQKKPDYVWPFESLKPVPYQSVLMVVEQMPRAWSDRSDSQTSTPLPAYKFLQLFGRRLPRPQRRSASGEEFKVGLEGGRLRLSFSMPSGYKLDPDYTTIRVRLYQVE
ncbi:MAG TPA: hypothetical protein VF251_14225 [Pyrinomonadaceae bacterium]